MTSYERLFKTVRGEAMDGHCVMPYDGNFSIHAAGYDVYDCYTNGKNMAEAVTKAWMLTAQDAVVAQSDQYYMCEGMGLKTLLKPGSLSTVVDVPVKSLKDIPKIKVPDPYHDGRMYVYIEAVGILAQRFGKEVPIRAPGTGAFAMAGHLMGPVNLIMSIVDAEDEEDVEAQELILQLLKTTCECHYRFVEACIKAGATIVQSGDSLASLNIISPSIYEKYAFPFEKLFFERISKLKKDYDFVTLLHVCGNNTLVAKKMADTGCDILECDYQVDLADYASMIGDKVCLIGNLNPAGELFTGTPDSVIAEAKIAMEKAKNVRHILGSGCEVAVEAPVENVKAMVDFGHGVPFAPKV